jgi:hypothetical protein
MDTVTFGDLLDRASAFEERVAHYYASIRDSSADNDVRLLTYYLARHRRHQEQGLAGLDAGQRERIRAVEMEHDIPFVPEESFYFLDTPPEDLTGRVLLEAAVTYDTQVIALYRGVLEQSVMGEARGAVETLIRIEERDIVMIKKMMAMQYF